MNSTFMVDLNSPHPYLHTRQFSTRVYLKSKKFTTSFNPLQLQPQSVSRNFKPTPQSLPTLKRTFGRVAKVTKPKLWYNRLWPRRTPTTLHQGSVVHGLKRCTLQAYSKNDYTTPSSASLSCLEALPTSTTPIMPERRTRKPRKRIAQPNQMAPKNPRPVSRTLIGDDMDSARRVPRVYKRFGQERAKNFGNGWTFGWNCQMEYNVRRCPRLCCLCTACTNCFL